MKSLSKDFVLSQIESAWNQIRDKSSANVIQFYSSKLSTVILHNFFDELTKAIRRNSDAVPAFAARMTEYANAMNFTVKLWNLADYLAEIHNGIFIGSRHDDVKRRAIGVVAAFQEIIDELQQDPSCCPAALDVMEERFDDLVECIDDFLSGSPPESTATLKNFSQVAKVTFCELRYALRYQKQLYVLAENLSTYIIPEPNRFLKKRPQFSSLWAEAPGDVLPKISPDEDLAEIAGSELDTCREIPRSYVMTTRQEEITGPRMPLRQRPANPPE
jgi:hypothetical protein